MAALTINTDELLALERAAQRLMKEVFWPFIFVHCLFQLYMISVIVRLFKG
jgi:hypothetical protein